MNNATMAALRVRHIPRARIGMIERHGDWSESEPEQPAGGFESCLDHLVELEVRLDLGFIEIEPRLAELLRVVAPIVRRQREIAALLRDQLPAKRLARSAAFARALPQTSSSSPRAAAGVLAI